LTANPYQPPQARVEVSSEERSLLAVAGARVVFRATVFAGVLTALSLLAKPLEWWLWAPHPFALVPQGSAITFGNLHKPSLVALLVTVFAQWFIAGAIVLVLWNILKRRIEARNAT
jgi:hypothetical protein